MLVHAQEYSTSNIHSHNDYANALPFFEAYSNKVGVIEADVFLVNNELFVAHSSDEITPNNSLRSMYLEPISLKIKSLGGAIYSGGESLILMIDVKSEALPTLKVIEQQLRKYPDLLGCKEFKIVISGNRPKPLEWKKYPKFIYFDGRITEKYSKEELLRVAMISDDLKNYTKWNGKGVLTQVDAEKIKNAIATVHNQDKKIRFWSTQDNVNTWIALMHLQVDFIASDDTPALGKFIKDLKTNYYQNTNFYQAYVPKNQSNILKKKTPKNIIFLIGDGMGLSQIYAGYTANKGQLNLFNIPTQGFSITQASDSYITDSAAGATAMSTGQKTNNRFIGVDQNGNYIQSIIQKLVAKKFQTALISSGNVTDATPAAFYAHQTDRSYNEAIAFDFLKNPTDILIGGGIKEFSTIKEGKSVAESLIEKGYAFSKSFSAIDSISNSRFVITDDAAVVAVQEGRGDFLKRSLTKVLATFSNSSRPFFIMEEGAQIDYGGHKNDLGYVVRELLDFDRLVGQAMAFVDKNQDTLLIVTADHETGGLSLIDGSTADGYVHGNFSTNDHTSVAVPVFAYGPGSENFSGVYQNTAIFTKILDTIGLK